MGAILKLLTAVAIAVGAQYLICEGTAGLDELQLGARVLIQQQFGRPINSPELLDAAEALRARRVARLSRASGAACDANARWAPARPAYEAGGFTGDEGGGDAGDPDAVIDADAALARADAVEGDPAPQTDGDARAAGEIPSSRE